MRPNNQHISQIIQSALIAIMFVSCIDDSFTRINSGTEMLFVVDIDSIHTNKPTRGIVGDDSFESPAGCIAMTNSDDTDLLYLHSFVSENLFNPFARASKSRGIPVSEMTHYTGFGIFGYTYSSVWDGSSKPDFMYNVEVFPDGEYWKPTGDYRWDENQNHRFYAYAPYNCEGIEFSPSTQAGAPVITYTIPSSAQAQNDLLVAESDAEGNPASLDFEHALSGIRFVTDDMPPGSITSITLRGIYSSGVYEMDRGTWTELNNITDFSQEISKSFGNGTYVELISQENTFMMIPQILPNNAQIEVKYTEAKSNRTFSLTADISGAEWKKGILLTYHISTRAIIRKGTLVVTEPQVFPPSASSASKSYKVTSYITTSRMGAESTTLGAAYKVEYVEDDGHGGFTVIEKPQWLTSFRNGQIVSNSSTAAVSKTVGVQGQVLVNVPNRHDERLKNRTPVSGTYDLSTKGGLEPRSTANCYIVNAPGRYTFPLVYGNAIKNGADNPVAYKCVPGEKRYGDLEGLYPDRGGTSVWVQFVNHRDQPIENPYIYMNTGCVPSCAKLLWQDEQDLVTDVALSADGKYITFKVESSTIMQGNALLAVCDASGEIMWSWHIWVTDYEPGLPPRIIKEHDLDEQQYDCNVINADGTNFVFMGVNLGWCDDRSRRYERRSVMMRFTQEETGLTQIITIRQLPSYLKWGNYTMYMHGSKNPMPSPYFTDDTQQTLGFKTYWPQNAFDQPNASPMRSMSLGENARNPLVFNVNNENDNPHWVTSFSNLQFLMNLWDADRKCYLPVKPVTKTVYDPSPRGYCVPPKEAFSSFMYQNTKITSNAFLIPNSVNTSYKNIVEVSQTCGVAFYCKPMLGLGSYDNSGGIIFFPFAGEYNSAGVFPKNIGKSTILWTANSSSHYPTNNTSTSYTVPKAYAESIIFSVISGSTSNIFSMNLPNDKQTRFTKATIRPIREQ